MAEWEAKGSSVGERPRTRFKLGPGFDRSQVAPLAAPAQPVALEPPIAPPQGDELAWAFPRLVALAGELGTGVVIEAMPDGRGGHFIPSTM